MPKGYKIEILAGITSFLSTMYVIVVNPAILQSTGMPFSAVLTATILVSGFSSIMMGVYAKNPIVVAPGMGINVFFTYTIVLGMKIPWQVALGVIFWSGIVFLVLSITNMRSYIVKAIPKQLRYGIAAGIGLFISFIGLKNAGFIVGHNSTIVTRGILDPTVLTFLIGLLLCSVLLFFKVKGAFIISILITTVLAIPIGRLWGGRIIVDWNGVFAAPDFSLLFKLDFINSLKISCWPIIFSLLFTDMFDSLSTFVGVSEAGNLLDDEGNPQNLKQSMIVDAFSTTISGLFGTSSGTSYIESATGIEEGGRGGLTAVVAGLLFLPFMFFSPLVSVVPSIATAPVLVLVGLFMMKPMLKVNWEDMSDAIPAFLSMLLIPLTFSITQGIIWGFLFYTFIKLIAGQFKQVSCGLIVIDVLAILSLVVN